MQQSMVSIEISRYLNGGITYESSQLYTGKDICSYMEAFAALGYKPEHDGVAFEDLPDDWTCSRCKQPKEKFNRA